MKPVVYFLAVVFLGISAVAGRGADDAALQYLEVEGIAAARYKNRLAQVEKLRDEVAAIQKDWQAEMKKLKKAAKD